MQADLRSMQASFGSGSSTSGLGGLAGMMTTLGVPGVDTSAAIRAMEGQMEALRTALGSPGDIRARVRADIEANTRPSVGSSWLREFGIDVETPVRAMEDNQMRMMREAEVNMAAMQREAEAARRGRTEGIAAGLREETQRRREADARMEEEAV